MGIISILKFITQHPLNKKNKAKAIWRFIRWQTQSRINSKPIIYSFTEKAKLFIQRGRPASTGNLYCGLYEFSEMGFLLHFLRKGDAFADIGANIGSFTILASAHVGAHSYSFEPSPSTFNDLKNNISLNHIQEKVDAFNLALGSKKGSIDFTDTLDSMNHISTSEGPGTIKVQVELLDEILKDKPIPILIKIDVEGFETEVIRGASNLISDHGLKAIIIELPGCGSRYGFDENDLHEKLLSLDFNPFAYDPLNRTLSPIDKFGDSNTIYVRDPEFVREKLHNAPKVNIRNMQV